MKKFNYSRICNYVCVVLMLLLLITQFLPFWECKETCEDCGGTASISDYFWNPREHKTVASNMKELYLETYGKDLKGDNGKTFKFTANEILVPALVIFITAIGTALICTVFGKKPVSALVPFIGGLAGTYGYSTNIALQAGQNWQVHLVLSILVLVVSLVGLTGVIPQVRAKFKELF